MNRKTLLVLLAIPIFSWLLALAHFVQQAHADPACGVFSEKQMETADGHLTRYRDTCEKTICYVLSFKQKRFERLDPDTDGKTISCVKESP